MSKHHVVPKSRGGRETERICHTCHSQIHALFSNKGLEQDIVTIENLMKDPRMWKYLSWVKNINPDAKHRARKPRGKKRS